MNGGIQALAGEVEAADAGDEIDGDVGLVIDEIGDHRHQQRVPKVGKIARLRMPVCRLLINPRAASRNVQAPIAPPRRRFRPAATA